MTHSSRLSNQTIQTLIISVLLIFGMSSSLWATIRLPLLFSDNMVLQQKAPIHIWGWADNNELVTVTFQQQKVSAFAKNGKWELLLNPCSAGGPYRMTVAGHDTITINNVLVGEVWICSGQSNMEIMVMTAKNSVAEIAAANDSLLRMFTVTKAASDTPLATLSGGAWQPAVPEFVDQFSAVGYFYARELRKALGVPVGMIHASWGGTPVELWIKPGAVYNAMIAPLMPYTVTGAIWYQGENNTTDAMSYRTLLPAMIESWRTGFSNSRFPFYIVQLANFMAVKEQPEESQWAELREAQLYTAQTVKNSGLAVAIDIGDAIDIHPANKQEVGRRLALVALAKTYGKNVVASGPVFKSARREGKKIRLIFDCAGSSMVAHNSDTLQGFAIAAQGGRIVWAQAKIEGNSVLVWSDAVSEPAMVRYGWADNPVCNLYNKAGLPASPFRTDGPRGIPAKSIRTITKP